MKLLLIYMLLLEEYYRQLSLLSYFITEFIPKVHCNDSIDGLNRNLISRMKQRFKDLSYISAGAIKNHHIRR